MYFYTAFKGLHMERSKNVVILGMGGTIAGLAPNPANPTIYGAGQVSVEALLGQTGSLEGVSYQTEQVAQIDSKDMRFELWRKLAQRVVHHLARPEVQGIVITHGTDTLEETAYFLHCVLTPEQLQKPVVLTGAMRPSNAPAPDGPQNLFDAIATVCFEGARGVLVAFAGALHSARDVQKTHPQQLDAFSSGDAGSLGFFERPGLLRLVKKWHQPIANHGALAAKNIASIEKSAWPRVEVVMNYAGSDGALVRALCAPGPAQVQGLVAAGTGNGTLSEDLHTALVEAQTQGIRVMCASRCLNGFVMGKPGDTLPHCDGLSVVKARVALILELLRR